MEGEGWREVEVLRESGERNRWRGREGYREIED